MAYTWYEVIRWVSFIIRGVFFIQDRWIQRHIHNSILTLRHIVQDIIITGEFRLWTSESGPQTSESGPIASSSSSSGSSSSICRTISAVNLWTAMLWIQKNKSTKCLQMHTNIYSGIAALHRFKILASQV